MKNWLRRLIVIMLLLLALSACQADQKTSSQDETVYLPVESFSEEQAYPNQAEVIGDEEEAYPVQNEPLSQIEQAYPVSSEDLQLLNKTWFLSAYRENGEEMDLESKTIKFWEDSFEITTDDGTTNGKWTAEIESPIPTLILVLANGETQLYQLITLSETNLTLQTYQEGNLIEEIYLSAD